MAGAVRQKGWAEHKEHDQQNENFFRPGRVRFTFWWKNLTQFCLFKSIPAKIGKNKFTWISHIN